MRGIVFTINRRRRNNKNREVRKFTDISLFFRRYGAVTLFTIVFSLGMLMGSLTAKSADQSLLDSLDFLFTTNIGNRLNQPVFGTFAASFCSNFIFLLFVFLCGLAPWGAVAIPFAPAFKGFGTGLSAGYLFITYGLRGMGFYLLVILGGTFIFSFALILECVQSHLLSLKLFKNVFAKGDKLQPVSVYVRSFMFRSFYMLLLTAAASLADMFLWTAFSGLFFG